MTDGIGGLGASTPAPGGQTDVSKIGALAGYAAAIGLVAVAAILAFVAKHVIAAPNLTLIFVLPVVVAATGFGWRPALVAAAGGVLAFDFFFTEPFYTFRITSPSDMWAAGLLLVIAAIVSTVAAQSRRRAVESGQAAVRAGALHDLAHLVVEAAPATVVAKATAEALARIFEAPCAVLVQQDGRLEIAALARGAVLSAVDLDAAQWALENQKPLHGDAYPFDASSFDFWPMRREGGPGVVLGVGDVGDRDTRPDNPARYVELAGAYLAASLTAPLRQP